MGFGRAAWAVLLLLGWLVPAGAAPAVPGTSLGQAAPVAAATRGVWMWPADMRREGAEAAAERLAQHHINKVYFLVKGLGGRVCYPSAIAPGSAPEQDTLKAILQACHKRHIEVHAWYMFNGDNAWGKQHPEDVIWRAGRASAWNAGPERAADGETLRICPLSQDYLRYLQNQVQEVLERYPVDGIHLDGIRYSHATYCFCPRHQALAATNGVHLEKVREAIYKTFYAPHKESAHYCSLFRAGDPDVAGWVRLREQEINHAVTAVRAVVKAKNPALVLSASFMPEGGEREDSFARCHYAQNYATAGAEVDYILPMTYHKSFGKPASWVVQITRNAEEKSHRPVYSGIQAFGQDTTKAVEARDKGAESDPNGVSSQDLREAVLTVEQQGLKGFVLFRYGSLTEQMWQALP